MTAHDDLLARHRAVMPDWLALYYDHPIALASGPDGTVYVADMKSQRVLAMNSAGQLTTVAGVNGEQLAPLPYTAAKAGVHMVSKVLAITMTTSM